MKLRRFINSFTKAIAVLLLLTISCKEETINCDSFDFTLEEFLRNSGKIQIDKRPNGTILAKRFYEEGILKDVCTFTSTEHTDQYVFLLGGSIENPRFIVNYDTLCKKLPSTEGKIALCVSDVFGDIVKINQPYTVDVSFATPPKMYIDCKFYFSPDKILWSYYGSKLFFDKKDGTQIIDTVSPDRKYCMITCKLITKDSLYTINTDTVYYSLNIQHMSN